MRRAITRHYKGLRIHNKHRKSIQFSVVILAIFGVGSWAVLHTPLVKAALPAPGGIDSGLIAWQKADDGTTSNASTTWLDSSGSGNTPSRSSGAFLTNGINFNPAFDFGGNTFFNYASNLGVVGTSNFSSFTAFRPDVANNAALMGHNTSGAQNNFVFTSGATGTVGAGRSGAGGTCGAGTSITETVGIPRIGAERRTYPSMITELNGGGAVTGTCSISITGTARTLGKRTQVSVNSMDFEGIMSEFIHYNRDLTDTEMDRVNSYLAIKYGTTLYQTPIQNYIASDGTTTPWNAATNTGYNSNITGIGRDDNSALNQKQSKSVNAQGVVTVGHGTIATTNLANTNNFAANNSFLMFGDDNGAVDAWTSTGIPALDTYQYQRVPRTWKVQETGTVGPVALSFDVNDADADIEAPINGYYFINLTTGTATPLMSTDGSNYSLSGITLNNGDLFTIGTSAATYNVQFKKTVSPVVTAIMPGQTFTYTVTAENLGNVPQTGLSFFDNLTDVVDDATYNNDVNATIGSVSFNGGNNRMEWNGDLGVGQTAAITYSLTMNTPDTGDGRLDNGVVASGTGVNCTEDPAVDPDCLTTTPLPVVTSQKTLVGPPNPQAGDTVNYQFVITNQGAAAAATVPVADDLSQVLDDAVYNSDATATSGSLSYNPLTQRLSWSGGLATAGSAGDSVTVTYSVTVNDPTSLGDAILNNAIISPDCPNPPVYTPGPGYDADCVTSTAVSAWMARKTLAPMSGIKPGDIATYTIQLENTGAVNLTGLSLDDDMTDVLDDAAYNNDVNASDGTPVFTSPMLSWTGDLTSGQTATITYSATIKSEDNLDNRTLANAIGAGPMNCPTTPTSNSDDPDFNVDCAVLSSITILSVPNPSNPTDNTGGSLADTGQPSWLYSLLALITMGVSGGIILLRKVRT